MRNRLTIYDIAKVANVSTTSVYKAINDKNHLLHSVAFRIPNRLILLDKSPDTVAIWDYEKPN